MARRKLIAVVVMLAGEAGLLYGVALLSPAAAAIIAGLHAMVAGGAYLVAKRGEQ